MTEDIKVRKDNIRTLLGNIGIHHSEETETLVNKIAVSDDDYNDLVIHKKTGPDPEPVPQSTCFHRVFTKRIGSLAKLAINKTREYATENQFHNFDTSAKVRGTTPQQALWGMFLKHFVSIQDIVDERKKATPELINEKIGDAAFYLILLEALFQRDFEKEEKSPSLDEIINTPAVNGND